MRWVLISLLTLVLGCGPADLLNTYKKDTKIRNQEKTASKATAEGDVQITYPDPVVITPTASGNSTVTVSLAGPRGYVTAHKGEKKSAADKSSSKFSVDELIENTPTWLKLLILIALIFLIRTYITFTKSTMAGKALDAGLSMGIGVLSKGIGSISKRLEEMTPGNDEYEVLRKTRDEMIKEQADLKEQTRGNGTAKK